MEFIKSLDEVNLKNYNYDENVLPYFDSYELLFDAFKNNDITSFIDIGLKDSSTKKGYSVMKAIEIHIELFIEPAIKENKFEFFKFMIENSGHIEHRVCYPISRRQRSTNIKDFIVEYVKELERKEMIDYLKNNTDWLN